MRQLVYILIGFLIFGCGNSDRPSKPDNLISETKMSEIIYDVFVLNSAKGINRRILEQNGILPEDYVYEKHGIDSLQFANSNDYYSYDTKIYERIMSTVKQKIESEKKINEVLVEREEKTNDSLKAIKLKSKDSTLQTLELQPEFELSPLDSIVPEKPKRLKPKVFGQDGD